MPVKGKIGKKITVRVNILKKIIYAHKKRKTSAFEEIQMQMFVDVSM